MNHLKQQIWTVPNYFSRVIYSITQKQYSIEPSWFVVQSVSEPTLGNPSNKVDQVAAKNATSAFNVRTRTVVAMVVGTIERISLTLSFLPPIHIQVTKTAQRTQSKQLWCTYSQSLISLFVFKCRWPTPLQCSSVYASNQMCQYWKRLNN